MRSASPEEGPTSPELLARFAGQKVARLASIGPDGRPHLVPIVFAVLGGRIVSAVDHKPKRSTRLRRLANIRDRPEVALLADHYSDDWEQLWWVRIDGSARVVESGEEWAAAVQALRDRYPHYRERPPSGPAIIVEIERISGWEGS